MVKASFIILIFFFFEISFAQIPTGYYDNAIGKKGIVLQAELHNIIKNHTAIYYKQIWTAFQSTDKKANGNVWDMYSDIPSGTSPYTFTFVTNQCGSYSAEGDCYNREHSFPKSWFSDGNPMITDLFHIYATDGKVNNERNNFPYGEVTNPSWTSLNGSKLGPCSFPGYSGVVFEPIDEYKGDFARTYFYMATRYYTEDTGWAGSPAVIGSQLKPWALNLFYQWNLQDTVSQKEIDRNNAIFNIQHNRNPFIDRPDWIDSLYFPSSSVNSKSAVKINFNIYPNPIGNKCNILIYNNIKLVDWQISIYDLSGRLVKKENIYASKIIEVNSQNFNKGLYILKVENKDLNLSKNLKFIK